LQATDVDAVGSLTWSGSPLIWSGSANGTYGSFTIDALGAWTYRIDDSRVATQALQDGEAVTETFTATVRDAFNATAEEQVVITVVGSYDPPLS
jgi:VCBS repeat-containing protein